MNRTGICGAKFNMKTVKGRLLRGEITPVFFKIVSRFFDKHEDSQVSGCFVNDFHLPKFKRGKIPADDVF